MQQRQIKDTIKFLRRILLDAREEISHPNRLAKAIPPSGQIDQLVQITNELKMLSEKTRKANS
jgi:hypothetical protein